MHPVDFGQARVNGTGRQRETQMRLRQATLRRQTAPFWQQRGQAYRFGHLLVSRFAPLKQSHARRLVPLKNG